MTYSLQSGHGHFIRLTYAALSVLDQVIG